VTLRWLTLGLLLLVAGCITTETKGPKTGSSQQRVQAYLDLARGYLEKKDFVNARRPLEQALKVDPSSAEAHVLMATLYIADGDKQLAERQYKEALSHEPGNPMAQNNYGTFLFAEGRYKDAEKHLALAAENSAYGRRAQAFENLGLTQLKLNKPADAEQSFLRALMLNTAQPRSAFELADLYFAKGDFTRCKEYFDSFNAMSRPTSRSLWLGIRLSRVLGNDDQQASYAMALKNMYPDSPEYKLYQDRSW
jgi:type IV pilus assembly protein PilF